MILKNIIKQKKYHAEKNATEHKLISNWTFIESVEDKNGVNYQDIIGKEPETRYTETIADIYNDVKSVANAITSRGVYTDISDDTETIKKNIHDIPEKIIYYGNATYKMKTNLYNIAPYSTDNIGMIKVLITPNTTVKANYGLSFMFTTYSDKSETVNYFGDKNNLIINVMKKESYISYEDALLQPSVLVKSLEFGKEPAYIGGSGYNKWYMLKDYYELAKNDPLDYSEKEKYVILFFSTDGSGIQPISHQNTVPSYKYDMTGSIYHLCGSMTFSVELIYS